MTDAPTPAAPAGPSPLPFLGATVLVRPFGRHGQIEQAAMVTRVWDDGTLNVTVMPDYGDPIPETRVTFNGNIKVAPPEGVWRWPLDAAATTAEAKKIADDKAAATKAAAAPKPAAPVAPAAKPATATA
jgi:hypothetical protein